MRLSPALPVMMSSKALPITFSMLTSVSVPPETLTAVPPVLVRVTVTPSVLRW